MPDLLCKYETDFVYFKELFGSCSDLDCCFEFVGVLLSLRSFAANGVFY
mgnify:CR=1 FL=1